MSIATLNATARSARFEDGSSIVRASGLPWTPWALPGNYFKLLSINRSTGVWSCLMKVDPNTVTPTHHHYGNAMIYVIEGGYAYGEDVVALGNFNLERGSVSHEPLIGPDGMLAYVMFFGGIGGVDSSGRQTGEYIDVDWMYRAAAANNAADHLEPPLPIKPGS